VKLPLTVVVLTLNEEQNLPSCLQSIVAHAEDVHVLDSGSTDATVRIAREFGVPVHTNSFAGFGQQRNWAIDNIEHRHQWVLHLDADERPTPELLGEIEGLLERDPTEAGFFIASKLMLDGHWLRYSSGYPVYQVRLFHRERLRFQDHGHGQREVTAGRIGYLQSPYLHEAFNKGLDDWFAKHARYARREAEQLQRESRGVPELVSAVFSVDAVGRRRAVKALAYKLPGRPVLRLFQLLLINRGILDGRSGVIYARMMATYEAMINVHLCRLKSRIGV
jgi:glycosyltransferase involved in cell wall biosynthesis